MLAKYVLLYQQMTKSFFVTSSSPLADLLGILISLQAVVISTLSCLLANKYWVAGFVSILMVLGDDSCIFFVHHDFVF